MPSPLFLWTAASAAAWAPWLASGQVAQGVVPATELCDAIARQIVVERRADRPRDSAERGPAVFVTSPVRLHLRTVAQNGTNGPPVVQNGTGPVAVTVEAGDSPQTNVVYVTQADEAAVARWRLGVATEPVPEALRGHLKLEDAGLLVLEVVSESGAAEAGLKPHDVLIAVSGTPLKTVEDLQKAVVASEGKKLKLDLIRHGERLSLEVAPRETDAEKEATEKALDERVEAIRRLLEAQGQQAAAQVEAARAAAGKAVVDAQGNVTVGGNGEVGVGPNGEIVLRVFGPGALIAHHQPPKLPANVKIVVSKQGEAPAQVVVTRDDEKFEGTAENLEKIPDDLRPFVEQMLQGHAAAKAKMQLKAAELQLRNRFAAPAPGLPLGLPAPQVVPLPPAVPPVPAVVEERLKDMDKRLERLQKLLEEVLEAQKADAAK